MMFCPPVTVVPRRVNDASGGVCLIKSGVEADAEPPVAVTVTVWSAVAKRVLALTVIDVGERLRVFPPLIATLVGTRSNSG